MLSLPPPCFRSEGSSSAELKVGRLSVCVYMYICVGECMWESECVKSVFVGVCVICMYLNMHLPFIPHAL